MMYKSGYVIVNGVPTLVRTWGGWIEDKILSETIILCITGNPGVTDFYIKFLAALYSLLGFPVWTLNHAGHELPKKSVSLNMPSLKQHPELYNLSGQINHKKAFIDKYIPKTTNICIIGHSVGAKITAELLKDESIANRVNQAHLIFPTLEHIVETRNGWLFTNITVTIAPILMYAAWIFAKLPYFCRFFLLKSYFIIRLHFSIEHCNIKGLINLFQPKAVRASIFLAQDEMIKIQDLDDDVYNRYFEKISAYYGQSDGWVPLSMYENLKKRHPAVKAVKLDSKFQHAFMFRNDVEMAQILADAIKKSK